MIILKNKKEIQIMTKGGKRLGSIVKNLISNVRPGMETIELDKIADDLIVKAKGTASFRTVNGYKWATCMCVNDEVVHGIPDDKLRLGDILCIDCGIYFEGFHTDCAWSVPVGDLDKISGKEKERITRFLNTGKKALSEAINVAKNNNRIGHLSEKIQMVVEGNGYSVVRALVGHGVGKKLHEEPQIPGFLDTEINKTLKIVPGMTLAIEVIYNEGTSEVVYKNSDGWTIITKDGLLSAVFEHTVYISDRGPVILTKF